MTQLPPAELARYDFTIRSFHPEKTFGWSGFGFQGDDRRFSLKSARSGLAPSRIWHTFSLDTNGGAISNRVTKSDPSQAAWQNESKTYQGSLDPRSDISVSSDRTKGGVYRTKVTGNYSGENHAMPYSSYLQEKLEITYVPSINVAYQLLMDVDRNRRFVDLVLYVKGDGFPNCEAFVTGPEGQPVFLGVHVRLGTAMFQLIRNRGYPMIACALRLPITRTGAFAGTIGDELARRQKGAKDLEYVSIDEWNTRFLETSPNDGRCMGLDATSFEDFFEDSATMECVRELPHL